MSGLLAGLRGLGLPRLLAMAAVAACVAGFLALLAIGGGSPRMAMLYGDLDLREAGSIAEALDAAHIVHSESAGGTRVDVAETDVDRARVLLARAGLPSGGTPGYELLDRDSGLTATEGQEAMTRERALEGELSRTLRTLTGVRAARVHLVLPKREPFARDRQEAQASVLLTMVGAQRLDPQGVQAVLNLVAAAVPGLRPQNIALVDSRGNVLARAGEPVDAAGEATGVDELRRATETRLSRAVEDMLSGTLGPGRVRATASVEMDVTQLHETQEHYAPDEQVVRSTQTTNDDSKSTEAAPPVTVANNLPGADAAAAPGAGNAEKKSEETTNYEIGKTVRTIVRDQPEIRRVSLAVMVDGTMDGPKGADGQPTWQPRSADDIARITALVRSAVGFDEKRGDIVQVVSMRFQPDDAGVEQPAVPRVFGVALEGGLIGRLAQIAVVGALALLALAFVLRPMVLRLSPARAGNDGPALGAASGATLSGVIQAASASVAAIGNSAPGLAAPGLAAPGLTGSGLAGAGLAGSGLAAASAMLAGPTAGTTDDDTMIALSQVDGQVRSSSIRRIARMIDAHPEESLSIVRSWLQEPA